MSNYDLGFQHGLQAFAYSKNGTKYVGSEETTLAQAISMIRNLWNYAPPVMVAAVDLEDLGIYELISLIETARAAAIAKQKELKADGGCSCHINPPCHFCEDGGSLEIP